MSTYLNPIIRGFHPDPSLCRVGDDYYLVTSTFEYFPGVPVFHSRDLVNWRIIGHCLTRDSQLPLEKAGSSKGIFAPTIRCHKGLFYMVTTNVTGGGHFLVTAIDPAGDWSEPVWIKGVPGIDPSLFFDADDKVYFTCTAGNPKEGQGIAMCELDPVTGRVLTQPRMIWNGTGGGWPEAPHLYRINGRYYLLIAEGGTGLGHMITIARSDTPWGPFESCPRNPILTHRHRNGLHPIQATGHGDLVQAQDGSWWLVFLGIRPKGGFPAYHNLGRETFLAPVQWTEDGWPVVGRNGMADLEMRAPDLPPCPVAQEPERDDFDAPELQFLWNHRRNPHCENYSLTERRGSLRLRGSAVTLSDVDAPTFVGRRQQHWKFHARTMVEFTPGGANEEAGLTALMNERHHYDLAIGWRDGRRCVFLRRRIGSLQATEGCRELPATGPVILGVRGDEERYTFYHATVDGAEEIVIGLGEARYLSTETAGGFTGVYLGLYATGNGTDCRAPAFFDWFEYTKAS